MHDKKGDKENILVLQYDEITAKINMLNQQLYSLSRTGRELMWGGGAPGSYKTADEMSSKGWKSSEIPMFPIVGNANGNKVLIGGKYYDMGRHGIARHVGFVDDFTSESCVEFAQTYKANTSVKSGSERYEFPFSYTLRKSFQVTSNGLEAAICVQNKSENEAMPFAVGWHPAFVVDYSDPHAPEDSISIPGHGSWGLTALLKLIKKEGALICKNAYEASIKSRGNETRLNMVSTLPHMMIWSQQRLPFICIETISALPDGEYSGELGKKPGYQVLEPGAWQNNRISIKV